jgi:hypothetical protein
VYASSEIHALNPISKHAPNSCHRWSTVGEWRDAVSDRTHSACSSWAVLHFTLQTQPTTTQRWWLWYPHAHHAGSWRHVHPDQDSVAPPRCAVTQWWSCCECTVSRCQAVHSVVSSSPGYMLPRPVTWWGPVWWCVHQAGWSIDWLCAVYYQRMLCTNAAVSAIAMSLAAFRQKPRQL